MKKLVIEIKDDNLKQRFIVACARERKTQKEVITSLIIAWLKRR